MRFLPITNNEKARIACFPEELDKALKIVQFIFAGRCRMKVAIHNGVAVIVVF